MRFILILSITIMCFGCDNPMVDLTENDNYSYPALQPTYHSYGSDNLQFGELYVPEYNGELFSVIMIIHGGCWLSSYDLSLMDSMAYDLAGRGYAAWNIEYRRTEDPGGGWPGTFIDVALALKHLESLADSYPLDLEHILVTGHSAGGHLALFLGAQTKLPANSELKVEGLPDIKGIVSLAGITDLDTYYRPTGCGGNVPNLVGGLPQNRPERYAEGSPISHLPLGIPQVLINGESDNIVPLTHVSPYIELAKDNGDPIDLVTIPNTGHFEPITPGSSAWEKVIDAFGSF